MIVQGLLLSLIDSCLSGLPHQGLVLPHKGEKTKMTMLSLLLVTENQILLRAFGFSDQDPEGLVHETGSRSWEAGKRKLKCPEF